MASVLEYIGEKPPEFIPQFVKQVVCQASLETQSLFSISFLPSLGTQGRNMFYSLFPPHSYFIKKRLKYK